MVFLDVWAFLEVLSVIHTSYKILLDASNEQDRVRNDDIRDRLGVAPIEEKLVQHQLRWFGHVQRRPPEAPVCTGILSQDSNVKRGRGRPKLTWVEAIKGDLKGWNIPKDLALDRSAWKTAIHVPEP